MKTSPSSFTKYALALVTIHKSLDLIFRHDIYQIWFFFLGDLKGEKKPAVVQGTCWSTFWLFLHFDKMMIWLRCEKNVRLARTYCFYGEIVQKFWVWTERAEMWRLTLGRRIAFTLYMLGGIVEQSLRTENVVKQICVPEFNLHSGSQKTRICVFVCDGCPTLQCAFYYHYFCHASYISAPLFFTGIIRQPWLQFSFHTQSDDAHSNLIKHQVRLKY